MIASYQNYKKDIAYLHKKDSIVFLSIKLPNYLCSYAKYYFEI